MNSDTEEVAKACLICQKYKLKEKSLAHHAGKISSLKQICFILFN